MLLFAYLSSRFNDETITFLRKSDECMFSTQFRTPELNHMLMSAIDNIDASTIPFDADSFSATIDLGTSSTATPFKACYVPVTCKELKCATMSGISSGLKACGIVSACYKIKDDNNIPCDLQIDRVLHLQDLL